MSNYKRKSNNGRKWIKNQPQQSKNVQNNRKAFQEKPRTLLEQTRIVAELEQQLSALTGIKPKVSKPVARVSKKKSKHKTVLVNFANWRKASSKRGVVKAVLSVTKQARGGFNIMFPTVRKEKREMSLYNSMEKLELWQKSQKNLLVYNKLNSAPHHKMPLKVYDKVFYYYTLQTPLTMYAHKAFILLEMQLNTSLVRAKLVPYLFMVHDLCFYRLVHINQKVAKNPYQIVSLYDSLSLPVYLHNYMYYRQYRIQYYPANISKFFKNYWSHFTNYTSNKVWMLSNFVASDITAEAIVFEYPNIALYMGPFRRFTRLYYRNQPYAPKGRHSHLTHTHSVLKLKLFEYASFYR